MKANPTNKLFTFFTLYIAQAVPMSLFSTLVPVIMRQQDFSLTTIGLLQLIKLPWILKFLWAPIVDKQTSGLGTYKRWIFSSEIIYAGLILLIAFLDLKMNFYVVLALLILSFIASATQDIATDALAARSFSYKNMSIANSMQCMGSFAGSLIGGGILLLIYKHVGWNLLLICVSLFVLAALLPLLFYRDSAFVPKKKSSPIQMKEIFFFFKQKGVCRQLIFLIFFYSGIIGILTMVKPYLVDLGYKTTEIGLIFGVFGASVGCVFSYLGGYIIQYLGRFYSRILFAAIMLVTAFLFWLLSLTTPNTFIIYAVIFFLWGSYGMASVLVYTTAMDFVREGREGTDFTLQTVISHLSSMILAIASGKIADLFGYSGLFAGEIVLAVISLVFILTKFKKETRNE